MANCCFSADEKLSVIYLKISKQILSRGLVRHYKSQWQTPEPNKKPAIFKGWLPSSWTISNEEGNHFICKDIFFAKSQRNIILSLTVNT